MPFKIYKLLLIIGISAILIFIPVFWFSYSAPNDLEIDFLDIGQGDAILIKPPFGQNILIDGGPDDSILKELANNLPWWDKQISLMILTHPHDDHVSGLIDVIKRYRIEKILYTGVVHNSPNYLAWLDIIREKKISLIIIDRPQKISFGENCYLDILYPIESLLNKEVANLNNSSLVIKLIYGSTKFLLTGDAEIEVEHELLNKDIDLSANVLKAGHHGSDTSSSQEFLEAVNPEIFIIQSGDNDFGHPSRRILMRAERIRAEILRNDIVGTIKLTSNGNEVFLAK